MPVGAPPGRRPASVERRKEEFVPAPKRHDEAVPAAPPGVTVVLCDGHRCHGLRDRTDTGVALGEESTLLGALREGVRRSRRAVLIRSGCLGVCARAPVVWVARGTAARSSAGTGVLFGPVEDPAHVRELLRSVADADDPSSA
jgi:(2Fe-2S) ferredoxin